MQHEILIEAIKNMQNKRLPVIVLFYNKQSRC